jgi:hypothetical protein
MNKLQIQVARKVRFGQHGIEEGRAIIATGFGFCVIVGVHGFYWGRV